MTGDNSAPMEAPSAKAHRCEGDGAVDAVRGEREIVKKIFFTAKQIEEKQYGAILGFRGQTHKMLEKETGARIMLGGKGITLTGKAVNLRLNEKPHRPRRSISGTRCACMHYLVLGGRWWRCDADRPKEG